MKFSRLLILLFAALSVSLPDASYAANTTKTSTKHASKASKPLVKKQSKKLAKKKGRKKKVAAAREFHFSALVVNADSGQVLYEKNARAMRYPASLTKMMTLYLTFDALKHRKMALDSKLDVTEKASQQPQTNIALSPGDDITVEEAIESLVVRSANDSAMVLAENIGKTEFNFALMMTKKARELGMRDTVFRNPSGLPDNKQHTTAMDMARLGIALRRDFPEYYHYFKMQSFSYNGVTYPGHNRVLSRFEGADGVKTGYIRASGFNLVTSAERDGRRLVAVIIGGQSSSSRDNQMIDLLDRTFDQLNETRNASIKPSSDASFIDNDEPTGQGSDQ